MFHIIYTGPRIPSCKNEFSVTEDTMKHAQSHSLLNEIIHAKKYGVSSTIVEDNTVRHIFNLTSFRKNKEAVLKYLNLTVVVHANEYSPLKIYSGDKLYVTEGGNLGCPQLYYFSWPDHVQWGKALTSGWVTKNFTLYAEIKQEKTQ